MKSYRYLSLLFFSGIFVALFLTGTSCNMEQEKMKVESMVSDSVRPERTEVVEIRYSDSGQMKALMFAPLLERYSSENTYSVFNKGITAYFYDHYGKLENSLKANHAIRYEKDKLIEVSNDVRLTNIKGEKLNTEKLIWDQKTEKIHTDRFVKITTPENIIYGTGFEANQNFTEYKIFKVSGTISIKDEEGS